MRVRCFWRDCTFRGERWGAEPVGQPGPDFARDLRTTDRFRAGYQISYRRIAYSRFEAMPEVVIASLNEVREFALAPPAPGPGDGPGRGASA